MEAFLNELSLHSQYEDITKFAAALTQLNQVLLRIHDCDTPKRIFFDRQLYYSEVTADHRIFSSCLERLTDKSARLQFKLLFQDRLRATEWCNEALQEACSYKWNTEELRATGIAELVERRLQNRIGFLINFSPSRFPSGRQMMIRKADGNSVMIDSVNSQEDLETWCRLYPNLELARFTATPGRVPQESETILADRGRFKRTKLRNQGKAVYLDRRTNYFFCIDNLHGDHLEVFNSNKEHIGVADLNGVIDTSKAVEGRWLGD